MKNPNEAYEGEWDFDGSCAPPEEGGGRNSFFDTFTLGCFQWEFRAGSRTKLKKGKVQHRIKGETARPASAYAAAREYCKVKNLEARGAE